MSSSIIVLTINSVPVLEPEQIEKRTLDHSLTHMPWAKGHGLMTIS